MNTEPPESPLPAPVRMLQSGAAFLARHATLFVVGAALLSFPCPPVFAWVKGDVQACLLGIIMLSMGLTLTAADFRMLAQRPLDIFIGACAQYTIMPLIAFGLTVFFGLPKGIAAGLILVGCCPGGVSSNIMSFLCKGDVAFSVGMTTASTLLSPLMTPMLVLLLAGQSIDVDAASMFRSILWVTILPVGVGTCANLLLGKYRAFREFRSMMPGVAVIGLLCIVGGVVSAQGSHFFRSGLLIFAVIFLHNGLGYLLGYFVGRGTRMNGPKCRTLSIEVGMQNAGLATVLAGKHFAFLPEAAVAAAICCAWHSITGTLMAGLFNRLMARGNLREE